MPIENFPGLAAPPEARQKWAEKEFWDYDKIMRVQDIGLSGADDPSVLAWTAQAESILLTHDVATMISFAYDRIAAGLPMPGLFEGNRRVPVGIAIEEIILISECSLEGEWEGQIRFLPLS